MPREGRELKRFNLFMAPSIYEYYVEMSKEMGITISAAMVVALKQYMDSQKALTMGSEVKRLCEQLEKMQPQDRTDHDHNGDTVAERGGDPVGGGLNT